MPEISLPWMREGQPRRNRRWLVAGGYRLRQSHAVARRTTWNRENLISDGVRGARRKSGCAGGSAGLCAFSSGSCSRLGDLALLLANSDDQPARGSSARFSARELACRTRGSPSSRLSRPDSISSSTSSMKARTWPAAASRSRASSRLVATISFQYRLFTSPALSMIASMIDITGASAATCSVGVRGGTSTGGRSRAGRSVLGCDIRSCPLILAYGEGLIACDVPGRSAAMAPLACCARITPSREGACEVT